MPPKANVIIFKDNGGTVDTYREELEGSGHSVAGTAGTIEGLEILLARLQHSLLIEASRGNVVALVDNIAPWRENQEPDPKGVGGYAAKKIRDFLGKGVIIVAATSSDKPGYGNHYYNTREGAIGKLGPYVTSLRRKEL